MAEALHFKQQPTGVVNTKKPKHPLELALVR